MTNKRVAAYCRVSTEMQTGGMESQIRVLKSYCAQNEILNVDFYTDEGISGTKSSRPALDKMMAAVERGEVEIVIVYSFSRFARSTTHLLNALTRFKATGTAFVSITEKIDTNSPVGLAIFSLTGQSIPAKHLPDKTTEPITIGFTFDSYHVGPARLVAADEL